MKIAVVGSGVSGLVAASKLHPAHEITVFESDARIGGHVHTWSFEAGGRTWAVDSGFIVYNERNYPGFSRILVDLGVETQPSDMSFSVRHDGAGVEYNGGRLSQIFVQPRNMLRPSFLRMLADILHFNRKAPGTVRGGAAGMSLGEVLDQGKYSAAFRDWYLLPLGSAIWSLPRSRVLEMPAIFFMDFLENHGMLDAADRLQWRVVRGGSARYVDSLAAPLLNRIRLNHPVHRVARFPDRVEVDGETFDRVILACHSDQALALLADPTEPEREVLGALPYQVNDAVIHTDVSVLPRRRSAWGAWNYRIGDDPEAPANVTYNMNLLQSLDAPETFCVTLNDEGGIDSGRVLGRVRYHHPVATLKGAVARARRSDLSGPNRTHYCGAYWGNGFHEDGVSSALAVVQEVETVSTPGAPAGVR